LDLRRGNAALVPRPPPGCIDLEREAQEGAGEDDRCQYLAFRHGPGLLHSVADAGGRFSVRTVVLRSPAGSPAADGYAARYAEAWPSAGACAWEKMGRWSR